MRIAVLGAGFTGLTAAYRLLKKGHEVFVFEKESDLGGLATGFSSSSWLWTLEKSYHHWFTNDRTILKLAKEINHKVLIKRPRTDLFINGKRYQFDSAMSLLKFPYLPLIDRLKAGFIIIFLKFINDYRNFAGKKALPWLKKYMGEKATRLIWNPLFQGKFGKFKDKIALTWFWARIKKRTPSLAYPQGGFQTFADRLGDEIKKMSGKILLNTAVNSIKNKKRYCEVETAGRSYLFDKIIVTLPSSIFVKIAQGLPREYIDRITSIHHLHAQVLILILDKPFMDKSYWLNITDKNFPFLVLVEHTNFMDSKYYGGQHILYIGNYLPPNHPYLKMDAKELLEEFAPFLKKVNPTYHLSLITYHLFIGPFAQPVVTTDYPNLMPTFKTPLKNIYLANLDMVYPWDRGTNYAVQLGQQVASLCH